MAAGRKRSSRMSWLDENAGMTFAVLGLAGAALILLGAVGRIRFPYLGGMRMPWHDIDVALTEKERRACMIIGPLLWALALFLLLLSSFPGQ
jgi:hypothetical protein